MGLIQARSVVQVTQSVTRPANVTQYTAGDVIDAATGAGLTFSNVARGPGLGGTIRDAWLYSSEGVATSLDVELWLFSAALTAYDNDNVAFSPVDADFANFLCVIAFAAANSYIGTSGAGGNQVLPATRTFLPQEFQCAAGSRDLYGVLVARGTYSPASGEIFKADLRIDQA